jgi:hypothetical protein
MTQNEPFHAGCNASVVKGDVRVVHVIPSVDVTIRVAPLPPPTTHSDPFQPTPYAKFANGDALPVHVIPSGDVAI